jgi:hypothetical protein
MVHFLMSLAPLLAAMAVGTGAGWMTEEFELLGISFEDRDDG